MKYIITIALLVLIPLSATAGELEEWLIEAAREVNLSGAQALIAWGAYVSTRENEVETALSLAGEYPAVIELLQEKVPEVANTKMFVAIGAHPKPCKMTL